MGELIFLDILVIWMPYCFIREFQPKNILEIGGGTSTTVIFNALKENNLDAKLNCYTIESTRNIPTSPDCVEYVIHKGNFLTSFFEEPIDVENLDFVFIDAEHESYFATFYCYKILEKLKPNTLIQIHDIHDPNILHSAYEKKLMHLGKWTPRPTLVDEGFTALMYIKNKGGYRTLCLANSLLEKNFEKFNYIKGISQNLYSSGICAKPKNRFFNKINSIIHQKSNVIQDMIPVSLYLIKEK